MTAAFSTPWQSPYAAPWPTPFSIPWWQYTGDPSVVDEGGNQIDTWADTDMVDVQGWDMLTSEELAEHAAKEKFEVFLMTQPEFWPGIRDRFGLPIPDNQMILPTTMLKPDGGVAIGVFEVAGHDIESFGFHRWHPANIILLKRVEG